MSIPIEFRAWDKQSKQMFQVYRIDFREDGLYVNLDTPSRVTELREDWLFGDRLELMQFIGLKDKNGTKIYEGDVVRYSTWLTKDGNSPMGNNGFKIGNVYYFKSGFVVSGNELWATLNYKHIEVIGNIHQNPELIKESKE
jgi:uncharacterized phage protein (TIGR01671 family)